MNTIAFVMGRCDDCFRRLISAFLSCVHLQQKLRMGQWKPGDPLDANLQELLDYFKLKGVKVSGSVNTIALYDPLF